MKDSNTYDVLIVGGSYAGLAAGMALGRAMKKVLIIDAGKPCNRQTPYSHNFITQDGVPPKEIAALAKQQVLQYDTVKIFTGMATAGVKTATGFDIRVTSGETFSAKKLVFATGITDIMPAIPGYEECWGITVLHCPYCHGYEVRGQATGILGNGDHGFELAALISNWTSDLTLYTNGPSTLTPEQAARLADHRINIVETAVEKLEHNSGHIQHIRFKDGTHKPIAAIYAHSKFQQHSSIPAALGCELNDEGYIKVDNMQKTSVPGIFACGDNSSRMRTVANAVATGTTAGMILNKEMVMAPFR